MGTGVSPQSVHRYRGQSAEGSWVNVSVQRGFMGTGFSPQSLHGYRCQSRGRL